MSRSFSFRERILLIVLAVLLVAAAYYLGVFHPTNETLKSVETQMADIETELLIQEEKATRLEEMKTALAGIATDAAITPYYDNSKNVVAELNTALAGVIDYRLDFEPVELDSALVNRGIQMTFQTGNYASAKEIIEKLYNGPYQCDITQFKIETSVPADNSISASGVTVTLRIVYYEIAPTEEVGGAESVSNGDAVQ